MQHQFFYFPPFPAKFLKLEQLDQDVGHTADATGVSIDGTGQVGTYFYTAPEIEQGWPKIDEKVHSIHHYFILISWLIPVYIYEPI